MPVVLPSRRRQNEVEQLELEHAFALRVMRYPITNEESGNGNY